ncbi:integrin beta-PS isoform X1 [Procambarus clarkii]|uniref:integrin beta-PS isoform X1 n=1 Tax=Procambarus clarkii TaxID=6728 RepID=UPI003742AFF7
MWVVVMAMWAVVGTWAAPHCNTHNHCSDCITSPGCIWCSKENFTELPRCGSEDLIETYFERCRGFVADIASSTANIEDEELSGDDATSHDTIVQIRPQKVEVVSKVGYENKILFTYKHLRNYPVDLYYLMDGSKSMSDDKKTVTELGKVLVDRMKEITSNFKVGFGIFVDKTILPYISTLPFKASSSCEECEAPYSYKNILKLTDDSDAFVHAVKTSKLATNLDYPEGSLDALMQAMVCEEQVNWRHQSIRLILVSTDAGFHIAGDGKLGGITTPNDKSCHLDHRGVYTHDAILDYPSVGEIREMVEKSGVHLVFAITGDQEPLYNHLKDLIPRTSYNILAADSSNIIDILSSKVKDVISRVSLSVEGSTEDISVKLYSNCSGGSWEEHTAACTNLDAGDEVTFEARVLVSKCPEDKEEWNKIVTISPGSYTNINLTLELSIICECQCEKPGDQGFVPNAEQCSKHGDYKCGVCSCHAGYRGHKCECDVTAGEGPTNEASCKQSNSSLVCSGQGECKCDQCVCHERTQPERIWGEFCECTNYRECTGPNGELCSGHGDCDCNLCVCAKGWLGQYCECDNTSHTQCQNPQTREMCSGHGDCECNHCKCDPPYYGKFCEDCPGCSGKCDEYKPCVECQVFHTGELFSTDLCHASCTLFNSTIVESIGEVNGQTCIFLDAEECRVYFLYENTPEEELRVWVQEKVDCPTYHNIYYTMLGVLLAVVVIGLCVLIAWRIIVSLHDKREFEKFILDKQNAKWSEDVNPLYRSAITHVNNPMFATKMD